MTHFSSLYKRYAPDVYRFALYLSSERGEAEDIPSETLVRAWTSPEPIEMATVKGISLHDCAKLVSPGAAEKIPLRRCSTTNCATRRPDYAQAEQKEKLQSVMAELQKMPEASRPALLMSAVDGMAYEEIAQVLGVSLAVAKVKVTGARLALTGIRDA